MRAKIGIQNLRKDAPVGKRHFDLFKDFVSIVGKIREIRKEFFCNCKVLYWKCCKHLEQCVICLCYNKSKDSFLVEHLSLINVAFR